MCRPQSWLIFDVRQKDVSLSLTYHPSKDRLVDAREEIDPANVAGPFYVTTSCIICGLPPETAPQSISYDSGCKGPRTCRFFKQPETQDELHRVFEAMWGSCVQAVRYRGTDPEILRQIKERGLSHLADALAPR